MQMFYTVNDILFRLRSNILSTDVNMKLKYRLEMKSNQMLALVISHHKKHAHKTVAYTTTSYTYSVAQFKVGV